MNLYEINDAILDCMDLETGEILDIEKFDALNLARNEKLENIALWHKNLLAEAEALKAEKKVFEERAKSVANKAESLKNYLSNSLGGRKFETSKVKISFRKSTSVNIDEDILPESYKQEVVSYKIDKKEIGDLLKSGEEIQGAKLVENQNIQIK